MSLEVEERCLWEDADAASDGVQGASRECQAATGSGAGASRMEVRPQCPVNAGFGGGGSVGKTLRALE